jgi:hypothetical protein
MEGVAKIKTVLSLGATMNTYSFKLQRNNITQEKIIRAADLRAAKQDIEIEIEEGWSVISVCENGIPLSDMQGQVHVNYVLYRPTSPPLPGRDPIPLVLPEYKQIAVVETPWNEYELRIFKGNVTQVEPKFAANRTLPPTVTKFGSLQDATREAQIECADAVLAGWELYRGSY